MKKEIVLKYTFSMPVHSLPPQYYADFNRSWGFENGLCNYQDEEGVLQSKKFPKGYEDAFLMVTRGTFLSIEVTVYKDGTKDFKILK